MDAQILRARTKKFAINIILFSQRLEKSDANRVMGNQVLRSGTSVAANYRAACRARSKKEFISKIKVVEEEADETQFWLELIRDAKTTQLAELNPLYDEATQLTAIFTAIGKSAKNNNDKPSDKK